MRWPGGYGDWHSGTSAGARGARPPLARWEIRHFSALLCSYGPQRLCNLKGALVVLRRSVEAPGDHNQSSDGLRQRSNQTRVGRLGQQSFQPATRLADPAGSVEQLVQDIYNPVCDVVGWLCRHRKVPGQSYPRPVRISAEAGERQQRAASVVVRDLWSRLRRSEPVAAQVGHGGAPGERGRLWTAGCKRAHRERGQEQSREALNRYFRASPTSDASGSSPRASKATRLRRSRRTAASGATLANSAGGRLARATERRSPKGRRLPSSQETRPCRRSRHRAEHFETSLSSGSMSTRTEKRSRHQVGPRYQRHRHCCTTTQQCSAPSHQ